MLYILNPVIRVFNFQSQNAARQAASAATQLMTASHSANRTNRNTTSQAHLVHQCDDVNDTVPVLVQSLKAVQRSGDTATAQLNLINASQDFIHVSSQSVGLSLCVSVCLSIPPSSTSSTPARTSYTLVVCLSVCLSVCLTDCVCLSVCLCVCLYGPAQPHQHQPGLHTR